MTAIRPIPDEVRAAIASFLARCQSEAKPFAGTEALGAIRAMFPGLAISDADLEDAISSEAANAGFDVGYDTAAGSAHEKRKALQRREDEGGASDEMLRTGRQRRIDNDTDGTRRRGRATKERHRLV